MQPEISRAPLPVLPPELPREVSPKGRGVSRRQFIRTALKLACFVSISPLLRSKEAKAAQPTPSLPDLEVPESEISSEWRNALRVTTNVANWFRFPEKSNLVDDAEHLQNYINDVDIKKMVDLGITSVRLPVSVNWISRDSEKNKRLESVSAAISKFEKAGINTIISMHDSNPKSIEDPDYAKKYIKDWGALVDKLVKHHSHKTLALDPVNEPVFGDKNSWMWNDMQRQLLKKTREYTSKHIFITKPPKWATREGLDDLALLNDPLVIYDVHFYEPYILTHQNANEGSSAKWANPMTDGITNLDFPVPAAQKANIKKRRNKLEQEYYEKGWNPDKVKQCVQEIADWGKKKKVPLWISEVGAWSKHMKEDTRELWMSTVAKAILESKEILGIGIWSWDEMFGFNAKNNVELDQTAVKVVREHVKAIAALYTQAGRIYTGEPR